MKQQILKTQSVMLSQYERILTSCCHRWPIAEAFFDVTEDVTETGVSYLDDYMSEVVEEFYKKFIA